MSAAAWTQAAAFVVLLTALTPVVGAYLARVFQGEPVALDRVAAPVERLVYRALATDPRKGQDWKEYARSVLVFSALCFVALYALLRTQGVHPFNPEGFHSGTWDVSFNTATSFVSNTSWQYYAGETTSPTSPRWRGSRCTASCPRRSGWQPRSPSYAGSRAAREERSETSGAT